jgi:hypothetical protein
MSVKVKVLAALASLVALGGVTTIGAASASAGTPQCGSGCIGIFSAEYGTPTNPGFIETVRGGVAHVGVPTELFRISDTNPAQDLMPVGTTVASFYAQGKVSAAVAHEYSGDNASQIEYAPLGKPTGLCAGLATNPYQNEGLTLQPCSTPGTTVWIIDSAVSSVKGAFALVNGANREFTQPYGMTYYVNPAVFPAQIRVARLQINAEHPTAPVRQLWGAVFGPQS